MFNIILTAADSSAMEWSKSTVPHEFTHLLVGEAVFGPFGDVPIWVNEGLAQYAEGEMEDNQLTVLDEAAKTSQFISIRSMTGSYPTDTGQAYLAYAESNSIMRYLIENYGWEKVRQLLAAFKDGATPDKALQSVYGFDTDTLETQWKAYLASA